MYELKCFVYLFYASVGIVKYSYLSRDPASFQKNAQFHRSSKVPKSNIFYQPHSSSEGSVMGTQS
jgi:hypothetical protein